MLEKYLKFLLKERRVGTLIFKKGNGYEVTLFTEEALVLRFTVESNAYLFSSIVINAIKIKKKKQYLKDKKN